MVNVDWKKEPDETLVCFCSRVDKGAVVAAIRAGATDIKSVEEATRAGLGGRCKELNPRGRCCHSDIDELLKIYGNTENHGRHGIH